ncbi:MAG: prolipoprotein diacylglyceryl transferase [Deltaproteobacteria bacterium]|nr:prolipoprotein diacylglyceryl transferase [Deltaproteobacteria bacterium]
MYPIIFQLGPITVYSFGAFMALAALSAGWILSLELKRHNYNTELASTIVFATAVGGLIGARLLFIVEEWQGFLAAPWRYIFTGAGFTWYGGFFGGAIAGWWVLKKNNIPALIGFDIGAPALALAYGVGRIGCHVAGDGDWGAVTDMAWGVAYTNAIVGWADPNTGIPYPPGVLVHPTPIYEFLQGALVFAILWSLRKKNLAPGTIAWFYLILASSMRFIVEIWRINPAVGFGLSEAQWFSAALVLLGGTLLIRRLPNKVP